MAIAGIITTSWDDGHALDRRLAEMLSRHGIVGTFYIPGRFEGHSQIDGPSMREMLRLGHECGAHTLNHVRLDNLPLEVVRREVDDGRRWLEDGIGEGVTSFCYPGGHVSRIAKTVVREAGFILGRTTRSLRLDTGFDPFLMPVTAQVYPHGRLVHARHALLERNWIGLAQWLWQFGACSAVDDLVSVAIDRIQRHGGILHLWGHSWEIDSLGWWDRLDVLLGRLARLPNVSYLGNAAAVRTLRSDS